MDDHSTTIAPAGPTEMGEALALVEALLAELGEEGHEYAQMTAANSRETSRAHRHPDDSWLFWPGTSGTAIGVLTLSVSFAVYAGGEYGVIDEMYVRPEYAGAASAPASSRRR